jgi:hypothetical protein
MVWILLENRNFSKVGTGIGSAINRNLSTTLSANTSMYWNHTADENRLCPVDQQADPRGGRGSVWAGGQPAGAPAQV